MKIKDIWNVMVNGKTREEINPYAIIMDMHSFDH